MYHTVCIGKLLLVDVFLAGGKDDLIFCPEDIGLIPGKEVAIGFSQVLFPFVSHEKAVGIIEQYPLVPYVLDKNRIGHRIDDIVQIIPGFLKRLLCALALADFADDMHTCNHLPG